MSLKHECLDYFRVRSSLIWTVKENQNQDIEISGKPAEMEDSLVLIGTENGYLLIYSDLGEHSELKSEIYVGRPVVSMIKKSDSEVVLF